MGKRITLGANMARGKADEEEGREGRREGRREGGRAWTDLEMAVVD